GIVDRVVHGLVLNLLSEAYEKKGQRARREMIETILSSHAGIADAIEAGDEAQARERMRAHICMFESDIIF
ncbi:MAG: FCD domain-containing protein, partial [Clostridia bacterium]|nr:FCD domain-containing protein [Clostridia bacterium]